MDILNPSRPAILMFVDDRKCDVELVEMAFTAEKIRYISEYYSTVADASARLEDNAKPLPDMIFIDRYLDDGIQPSGDVLIEKICSNRARYSGIHVVGVSGGELDAQSKDKFTKLGMETFFPKPLKMENVKKLIEMTKDFYYQIMRELSQAVA